MITEEMKNESANFGELMAKTIEKRRLEPSTQLHPELTEQAMTTMMSKPADDITGLYYKSRHQIGPTNRKEGLTRPRDFFNDTHNEETKVAFGISHINSHPRMTVSDQRKKYEGFTDPAGQWKVQSASDLAFRHMDETHKKEWLKADLDQRDELKLRHDFEKSYFSLQEAKYLKSPSINKAHAAALKDFQKYQGQNLGIAPDTQIKIEPKIKAGQTQSVSSKLHSNYQLGDPQSNMMRMRDKFGYKPHVKKQTRTMSRTM